MVAGWLEPLWLIVNLSPPLPPAPPVAASSETICNPCHNSEVVGSAAVDNHPLGAKEPFGVSVITPLVLKCVLAPPAASSKFNKVGRMAMTLPPATRRPASILNSGVGRC